MLYDLAIALIARLVWEVLKMTAAKLIEYLQGFPPDTRVVRQEGFAWIPIAVRKTLMFKSPFGAYGRFLAQSVEYKNDTEVIVIE